MGDILKKSELWRKIGVMVRNRSYIVRPSAPAIAIPPLPALLPATGVDIATPPGPTYVRSTFIVFCLFLLFYKGICGGRRSKMIEDVFSP